MSRRESRVSMSVRQNDALFEFEAFKKKFLLANKHITKLNSTLSVRIEELNAQISALYVENLRLRASEISLASELKKEREKSRKVMVDAEAATANLSKHLEFLRQSLNIATTSPPPSPSPLRRARHPIINPTSSPQVPRLSRAPDVPRICEDEEACSSDNAFDDHERHLPSSPSRRKTKPKARLSASRLPLPSRASPPSPPPLPSARAAMGADMGSHRPNVGKRKPSRRQSGLLNVDPVGVRGADPDINEFSEMLRLPRIPSPAFGSPVRRDFCLDDDDGVAVVDPETAINVKVDDAAVIGHEELELVTKRKRKGKEPEMGRMGDLGVDVTRVRERERKRSREDEELVDGPTEGQKSKLKDVTNSPRSRLALPPSDGNTADRDRHQTSESDPPSSAIPNPPAPSNTRTFLSTPASAAGPTSQYPTPHSSSSPAPPTSETEGFTNGRERRARKSVNYAEPKLNTKMRKPDPPPGTTSSRKRSSVSTTTHALPQSEGDVDDPAPRSSLEHEAVSKVVNSRLSSSPPPPALPSITVPSRPQPNASSSSTTIVKRKKSRPYLIPDDDESDGAQADVDMEYAVGRGNGLGWVNIEGRRRSHSHNTKKALFEGNVLNGRRVEDDDGRRHSMAV